MSTPDKCPHCGDGESVPFDDGKLFLCDTYIPVGESPVQSQLCRERAAHAATRKELESTTDTLDLMRDEFQRIVARMVKDGVIIKEVGQEILGICNRARSQIAQRVPVIAQRDAAESRVRQLEQKLSDAENQVMGGGYAAQTLRRACGLDNSKEDLMEVAELFDRLNARVRALEDQNSALSQSASLYKSRLEHAESANEVLRKQIAETERALQDAKADASSWQAQSDRFDRQFLEAAERVGELEGLASQVVKAWKAFDLAEGDWDRTDSERALKNSIDTLGEAMPQQKGGQS